MHHFQLCPASRLGGSRVWLAVVLLPCCSIRHDFARITLCALHFIHSRTQPKAPQLAAVSIPHSSQQLINVASITFRSHASQITTPRRDSHRCSLVRQPAERPLPRSQPSRRRCRLHERSSRRNHRPRQTAHATRSHADSQLRRRCPLLVSTPTSTLSFLEASPLLNILPQPLRRLHNRLLPLRPPLPQRPPLHPIPRQCRLDHRRTGHVPPRPTLRVPVRPILAASASIARSMSLWNWVPSRGVYIPLWSTT